MHRLVGIIKTARACFILSLSLALLDFSAFKHLEDGRLKLGHFNWIETFPGLQIFLGIEGLCHQPLQWIFSDMSKHVIFLDLNITLSRNTIATSIYEKLQNLYLYIPPHSSCHSPVVIKGLIYGCVNCAKALCTNEKDWLPYVQKTFNPLLLRGHSASNLLPTFNLAIVKIFIKRTHHEFIIACLHAQNKKIPLFFQLTIHLAAPYSCLYGYYYPPSVKHSHITT